MSTQDRTTLNLLKPVPITKVIYRSPRFFGLDKSWGGVVAVVAVLVFMFSGFNAIFMVVGVLLAYFPTNYFMRKEEDLLYLISSDQKYKKSRTKFTFPSSGFKRRYLA